MSMRGDHSNDTLPANDNALTAWLESEPAQRASLATILSVSRLAKCGDQPLTADQLARIQAVIETA